MMLNFNKLTTDQTCVQMNNRKEEEDKLLCDGMIRHVLDHIIKKYNISDVTQLIGILNAFEMSYDSYGNLGNIINSVIPDNNQKITDLQNLINYVTTCIVTLH